MREKSSALAETARVPRGACDEDATLDFAATLPDFGEDDAVHGETPAVSAEGCVNNAYDSEQATNAMRAPLSKARPWVPLLFSVTAWAEAVLASSQAHVARISTGLPPSKSRLFL